MTKLLIVLLVVTLGPICLYVWLSWDAPPCVASHTELQWIPMQQPNGTIQLQMFPVTVCDRREPE